MGKYSIFFKDFLVGFINYPSDPIFCQILKGTFLADKRIVYFRCKLRWILKK